VTEAKYFLVVRFWVAPEAAAKVARWLEGGHVAEVVSQPGFLWCRRLNLKENDAKGWTAFSMLYGIESRSAFERYESNKQLKSKFAGQREPFEKLMRIERFSGEVDFALDKGG
jgi:hypothetical protein